MDVALVLRRTDGGIGQLIDLFLKRDGFNQFRGLSLERVDPELQEFDGLSLCILEAHEGLGEGCKVMDRLRMIDDVFVECDELSDNYLEVVDEFALLVNLFLQ